MDRDEAFGRLLAVADVMGSRLNPKGPSISEKYMKNFSLKPKKFFGILHEELMGHFNKFGQREEMLRDRMGELVDQLDEKTFTNEPLGEDYLLYLSKERKTLWEKIKEEKK